MGTRTMGVVTAVVAALVMTLAGAQPASAVTPDPAPAASTLLGNDVSWPQCGEPLPVAQAFAIVGVNGGLANDTNPCLAMQLWWAQSSTGVAGQAAVGLYVNTANPGFAGSGGSWWPTSNSYPVFNGVEIVNPYGTCIGAYDTACAYMYGYAKAWDDVRLRGVPDPGDYTWWLDVESMNTWSTDTAANRADLEGMVHVFQSVGARVGLYSTTRMWNQIAGTVPIWSSLWGLPNWVPGAGSARQAQENCSASAFTPGSTVSITQFIAHKLDYNYSCQGADQVVQRTGPWR